MRRSVKIPQTTINQKRLLWRRVFQWYRGAQRALPWRTTRDPYRILVSEIMLQQTPVNHVAQKYHKFLRRFPSLYSLARARTRDVIDAWSGLGYNVRALRLQKTAQELVTRFGGSIPADPGLLIGLPGIGRYTANAISCFAFKEDVPVVDTNIRRLLSRLSFRMRSEDERISAGHAWQIAESLVPSGRGRDWALALMDLGSTICTSRRPRCDQCPVSKICCSAFNINGLQTARRDRKKEPSRGEIPNRIYRGRIVEVLRRIDGENSMRLKELGKKINTPFFRTDEAWLRRLLQNLERDGLVKVFSHGSVLRVSLP